MENLRGLGARESGTFPAQGREAGCVQPWFAQSSSLCFKEGPSSETGPKGRQCSIWNRSRNASPEQGLLCGPALCPLRSRAFLSSLLLLCRKPDLLTQRHSEPSGLAHISFTKGLTEESGPLRCCPPHSNPLALRGDHCIYYRPSYHHNSGTMRYRSLAVYCREYQLCALARVQKHPPQHFYTFFNLWLRAE